MRAIAIVLVILLHYSSPWRRGGYGVFAGGYLGVDIFFVLSGFLITSLLLGEEGKRKQVSFGAFYARRGLRLLPALVVLLAAHAIFTAVVHGDMALEVKFIAAVLFYVSNIAQVAGFGELSKSSLAYTWSLSIEEQFYLLWPALLLFGVLRFARTRRSVFTVLGAAIVASAVSRSYTWLHTHDALEAYIRTDGRLDGLLIGAAAAFVWRWRLLPGSWINVSATVCGVGLLLAGSFASKPDDAFMFTVGFTLVSLASAVVVLGIAEGTWAWIPWLASLPMRIIGRVSYGLYLWHGLGLRIAYELIRFRHGALATVTLGLVVTVVAVTASWFLVEQPALRLKRRFQRL